ncbi:hypothetical protein BDV33DRAFT_210974 [Aspergillus novoparasiticus]|uniref:Uncharacterized protein n=1 Tax=Aspergillus novoparasiticus TaxID=986946 RepID=A0A5N6E568_9EURO|nr:hypothetical protein BDV33DRAFT_210974 [Aspergillus novoparasiticus]
MGEALRDAIKLLILQLRCLIMAFRAVPKETYHGILRNETDILVLYETSPLGFIQMLTHADLPSDISLGSILVWSENRPETLNLEDGDPGKQQAHCRIRSHTGSEKVLS